MRHVPGPGLRRPFATLFALMLLAATHAAGAAEAAQYGWLKNFVRVHDGRTFCAPPGAQPGDFTRVVTQYLAAHPELEGAPGGQEVLSAFKAAYPCGEAAPAHAAQPEAQAIPAPPPVQEKPEPATESERVAHIVQALASTGAHENDALLSEIAANAGNYPPPVLFAMTRVLYAQGRTDDAIFWFNAARLRANYDALRCADASARVGVGELMKMIPLELRRAQFDNLPRLKETVERAIRWDEDTPSHYDPRWINPYGLDAAAGHTGPQSVPEREWPALAASTRNDYLASLNAAIRQIAAGK